MLQQHFVQDTLSHTMDILFLEGIFKMYLFGEIDIIIYF